MNAVAVQFDIAWEDRKRNFATVRDLLSAARIAEGSLIVLPEMFGTGFSMDLDVTVEKSKTGTEQFLAALAWEHQSHVVGGLVTRDASSELGRNELAVFGPSGQPVTLYQKNYTFSYAGESDYYQSGETLAFFDWNGFKVCPLICYDLRFPELFRRGVEAGATLFTVSANWPVTRIDHWTTLLAARAIENLAPVVGVNRIGSDPRFEYSGRSQVIDHLGRVLADGEDRPGAVVAPLDAEEMKAWREEFPALRDRKA